MNFFADLVIFIYLSAMENSFLVGSESELPLAVEWLKAHLASRKCRVVALYGDMGVGKTTFVSAFARLLGAQHRASSPTFAIVNAYDLASNGYIYHFDFYRIEDLAEAMDIGFFEYVDSGSLCFVEWPERVEPLLAQVDVLNVKIELDPATDARHFSIEPAQ